MIYLVTLLFHFGGIYNYHLQAGACYANKALMSSLNCSIETSAFLKNIIM